MVMVYWTMTQWSLSYKHPDTDMVLSDGIIGCQVNRDTLQ